LTSVGESRSILSRGYVALVLLVVFLAVAVFLPRLMFTVQPRGMSVLVGSLELSYEWLDNSTLRLNLTNLYRANITVDSISVCGVEVWKGLLLIRANETHTLLLSNLTISKTCYARVSYSVEKYKYSKLFILSPLS